MSAFYAPLRGIQTAIDQVVMLDTQMVELRRVMDATPQTYNKIMEDSINLASVLGNRIEDVNKSLIGFSKQGFNPDMLMDLTKTATVAANISGLTTEESMSSITAGLKAFNIEASDSMSIIDKMNEIDNNFAISTKDLSDGMMKTAATANTFGVSMEELLGMISAIGITTRESGKIVGKIVADIKLFLIDLELLT